MQCRSPSDPTNGSSDAPASVPRESWDSDSRDWQFPPERIATPSKRRAALASGNTTAQNGMWCPVLASITGAATALQASSNTYLTGFHHSNKQMVVLDPRGMPMRDLNHDFKELCRHNRDGSYATQADREHILDLIADHLHELGHRGLRAQGLKPKHVEKLVAYWLAEELSPGTIKNRMAALRWAVGKLGKDNIVARTNAAYGIADRVYVTNISKAKQLGMDQLESIRTPCAQMSLRLQAAFGLRREASIKIVPAWADRGDVLVLKDSWNKGGRAGDTDSYRDPGAAATPRRGQVAREGQELGRSRLCHLSRVLAALPPRMRACRHSRLPRASPFVRSGALQATNRLGVPSARWSNGEAAHGAAEGRRSPSSRDDQWRAGARSRTDYRGLFGSIAFVARVHEHPRSASSGRLLHIHPVTLQEKARAGEIPGAKIGRCWVFVDVDLIEHIRSQYPRRVLQSEHKELEPCHSTNALTHRIGGSRSATADEQYSAALGLKTKTQAQEYHDKLKVSLWEQQRLGVKPRRSWKEAVVRWLAETSEKATHDGDIKKLRWLDAFLGALMLDEITLDGGGTAARIAGASARRRAFHSGHWPAAVKRS